MTHQVSFKYAWEGIVYAFTTQPNFKVHALIALLSIILGIILKITQLEWLILLFTISLVLIAEMINTSIESMTDLIEEKRHQKAKIAKDVSAGMVLLSSVAAAIVGLAIFLPKIINTLIIGY